MDTLSLKPAHELAAADFVDHPVWVSYYEPDEVDELVNLGLNRLKVERQLQAIEFPERYVFPLPAAAASMSFKYRYLAAEVTTASGKNLIGYVTGPGIGVFCGGNRYVFNRALQSCNENAAHELADVLGGEDIFPLSLKVIATGRTIEFGLTLV